MMRSHFLFCFLLTACASTGTNNAHRERGLSGLREALALDVPVGQIVAGGIVHRASGIELTRLPPASAWKPYIPAYDEVTVLFEGAPGVAISFGPSSASIVRFIEGQLIAADAFERDPPTALKPLLLAESSYLMPNPGGELDNVVAQPVEQTQRFDLPGFAGPVNAVFTSSSLLLSLANAPDADPLAVVGIESNDPGFCDGHFTSRLASAKRADGATLLRFESHTRTTSSEQGCDDSPEGSDTVLVAWLALTLGGEVQMIDFSSQTTKTYTGDSGEELRLFELFGATLRRSYTRQNIGMGGYDSWTWTLTTDDGRDFVLASGATE